MSSADSPRGPNGVRHVLVELGKYPTALLGAFEAARITVEATVTAQEVVRWAEDGVRIARQTPRSWEAAAEYYRASPRVIQIVSYPQFQRWVDAGVELCPDSPTVAAAFFRASPAVLPNLHVRHIAGWAALGRSLSRGTWKSSSLAARFFDSSAELLSGLSFREVELFVGVVEALSQRSYDLAAECLHLGQRVLPAVHEREELIALAATLVDTSWREVRGTFEAASRVTSALDRRLRPRYYALTKRLAPGLATVSTFMLETTQALSRLPSEHHAQALDLADDLAEHSAEAVGSFLRTAPVIFERVSEQQVGLWYKEGLAVLKENPDGGIAYFRLESSRSEQVLDQLSSTIEFEKVKPLLALYANALAGSAVELQPATEEAHKNLGWVTVERATTDGSHVFLPAVVDDHPSKQENFSLLKVVTTHQTGHLELGSFLFVFDRPSTRFDDLRPKLVEGRQEPEAQTEITRFFNLFPVRNLAMDIFAVVEDARVDYGMQDRYRGLRPDYQRVQAQAVARRQPMQELPVQTAMVELLIRLSLAPHQGVAIPVPKAHVHEARQVAALLRKVQAPDTTVEDSAEATARIYAIISALPQEQVPPEDWETQDFQDDMPEEEATDDQVMQQLRSGGGGFEESGYESPEDVDYRGDFKPELVQLLARMRGQAGEGQEQQPADQLSQEAIEELLRESDIQFEDDAELATMASNMMKEVAAGQPPKGKGQGYADMAHQEDAGGALEAGAPRSYVYDEWDFRANDYRPRWCVVQEKQALTGETRFFQDTLANYAGLMDQIRRQFEAIRPEMFRRVKHLPEGEDIDFDAGLDAIIDIRSKRTPDERLYWRRNKTERDVGVAFLLDMSASTAEAVDEGRKDEPGFDVPSDPVAYTMWLRTRRGDPARRTYKRIIDVEKESMVLLMSALELIGDRYGVYGFSGFGRENVEFYVIKEFTEALTDRVKRRLDKVAPLHATRMGPAIRHATTKLEALDAKTKFLFVVSDGRPQDRGYSREGVEKEYAVQDTRMALLEARAKDITPFALTVDRNGHDYLRTMAGDMGYEVLPDVLELPRRLPALYRRLTL